MILWQRLTELILFFLLLLAAAGWGWLGLYTWARVAQRLERQVTIRPSRQEELFLVLVLGLGILSWLMLLLGLLGLYFQLSAWLLLLVGLGLTVPYVLGSSLSRSRQSQQVTLNKAHWLTWFKRVILILAASYLLYTLLAHVFMPPHEWDEIAYHLALPKIYAQEGQLVELPFIVHSYWPMNTEMLFTLGLLADSETLAHFVTWGMSLLTAFGLYLTGRRFFSLPAGLVTVPLFLSIPMVLRLSGTGLIDGALAFYGIAAIFSYGYYRQGHSLGWLGLCGAFSGLAAGSKLIGGAYPLLFGLFLLLDQRGSRWRQMAGRLGMFALSAALFVGGWYARSYVLTGNPVWPFFYDLFGGQNWDVLGHEYHTQSLQELWAADIPITLRGFAQSLYYLFARPELLGYGGGLGAIPLALGVVGIIAAIAFRRRTPAFVGRLALFCIIYYAIWFLWLGHQARFLFPLLPPLILIGGYAAGILLEKVPAGSPRLLAAGIFFAALVWISPWLDRQERHIVEERWSTVTGATSRTAFLESRLETWPALQYVNANFPQDATVLLLPFENRGYYLERAYVWGNPVSQRIIPFETYDGPQQLAADLKQMGITHILDSVTWSYDGLRHWEHDRALMLALENECGEQLAEWDQMELYRLTTCADGE